MGDPPGESAYLRAVGAFGEAHREDPRVAPEGGTEAERYHRTLVRWVETLAPDASELVRLAAWAQHVRRWTWPRSGFPPGVEGYRRWRSALAVFHGEQASAILRTVGYDEPSCARVRDLLLKKRLRSDPEVQLLEDAVCLTFLELEFAAFASAHSEDKVVDVLRKTWAKMSPAGRNAALVLATGLPGRLRALVTRAVSDQE